MRGKCGWDVGCFEVSSCWGWNVVTTTCAGGTQVWDPAANNYNNTRMDSFQGGDGHSIHCGGEERREFLIYDLANPPGVVGGVLLIQSCNSCLLVDPWED